MSDTTAPFSTPPTTASDNSHQPLTSSRSWSRTHRWICWNPLYWKIAFWDCRRRCVKPTFIPTNRDSWAAIGCYSTDCSLIDQCWNSRRNNSSNSVLGGGVCANTGRKEIKTDCRSSQCVGSLSRDPRSKMAAMVFWRIILLCLFHSLKKSAIKS